MDSFEEKDTERFFGRETLLENDLFPAFRTLAETPPRLLALVGPSGSGKSSVARAGLLPLLKSRLPCRPLTLTPTHSPLDTLANALARHALPEDPAPAGKAHEFRTLLAADGQGLARIAALLYEPDRVPLVLLVDQAEELFSLCRNPTEQVQFLDNLIAAVSDPAPHLYAILTLRSDFLGETQRFPAFNALLARQARLVPVLDEPGLRRAIAEPARRAGQTLDEAVVDLLVEQSLGRDGALPLLQYALTEIWRGMQSGRSPEETLRTCGGVGGALAGRAQQVYDALTLAEQAVARRCLLRLVALGEGGPDTRRRVAVDDLLAEGETRTNVLAILRRFAVADARFLALGRDAQGHEQAEITHDALIAHWGALRNWLDVDRDDLRLLARLDAAAKHWESQSEAAGLLWRRPDLDLLRRYAARRAAELSPLQARFYRAACRAERRGRLLRGAAVAALLLLTLTALGAAWWARRAEDLAERQRQQAQEAAAKAVKAQQQANVLIEAIVPGNVDSFLTGEKLDGERTLNAVIRYYDNLSAAESTPQTARLRRAAFQLARYVTLVRIYNEQVGENRKALADSMRRFGLAGAQQNPSYSNPQWQWSVTEEQKGQENQERGDYSGALERYQISLAIRERLAKEEPWNVSWQEGLSAGQMKIGALKEAVDDFDGALAAYQISVGIVELLLMREPTNTNWQENLASGQEKVAAVKAKQGDLIGSLEAYQSSLAIRERRAAEDPCDSGRQEHLATIWENIGALKEAHGNLAGALAAYQASLAVRERLAARDTVAADLQGQPLTIAHEKIGHVQLDQGTIDAAIASYQMAVATARALEAHREDAASRDLLASTLANQSFALLFVHRFDEAVAAAEEALRLAPDQVSIATNLAHGHLLAGRFDQAQAIYRAHWNEEALPDKTFAEAVREDFAKLRAHGIDHPDIARIEALPVPLPDSGP